MSLWWQANVHSGTEREADKTVLVLLATLHDASLLLGKLDAISLCYVSRIPSPSRRKSRLNSPFPPLNPHILLPIPPFPSSLSF